MAAGDEAWALRAFRELDDAILRLRLNEPEIGTILLRATGDPQAVLDVDAALHGNADHWLVREIVGHIRRTLKRVDLTARSLFALIEPGNAFAGTLFELALAVGSHLHARSSRRAEHDSAVADERAAPIR